MSRIFTLTSILIFLLISDPILCQSDKAILKGKVSDSKTRDALVGVNIYVNNSTVGTTSDKNGNYLLSLEAGGSEIVFSMIGYEPKSSYIQINKGEVKKLDISLSEKTYQISQIDVEDQYSEEWFKKLNLFKSFFIGENEFSRFCTIKNENEIYFSGDSDTLFEVHSYKPLVVLNRALGYILECSLIKFECDPVNNVSTYSIKTKFTDLSGPENQSGNNWIENRRRTYLGSLRHFFYSAISKNDLSDFDVHLVNHLDIKEKGIKVQSRDEFTAGISDGSGSILSFNELLRVKYKYSNNCSWLKIEKRGIRINRNGYLIDPLSVLQYGSWAFYGMSKSLPIDYISF